ncbi:MAG TPA: hypothetical protein VGS23_09255 [Thermoplasmata archaeon]|nr:hypothetical protein [Thermoplasmata archaeon]
MAASTGNEDPIAALFELADRVAEQGPKIRRIYAYTAAVVGVFLAILVYLLFEALRGSALFVGLALVTVVLGGTALTLLAESDRFYRSFSERHRRLRMLQFAEPTPKIPRGSTPLRRLAQHLARTSPRVAARLVEHPRALSIRTRRGANGALVEFGLSIAAPESFAHRYLKIGDPGFVVLARLGPDALTVAELERFGETASDVARSLHGRLVRAIVLRTRPLPIDDDVYELSTHRPLAVPGGPSVPLEVITELEDGTYDLIPHVIGVP